MLFPRKPIPTLLAVGCALACAQAAAQQDTERLQRVEVTGSHIKRAVDEGSAPVQVLNREELKRLGVATVREMLDTLASSTNSLSDIGGSNSFASGSSSVSLRNMGKQSTLVLLNSRRVAPYPLADFNEVFTNLDTLPSEVVERIEILKSGASSIYGSDAVAGVINIITRSDFTGFNGALSHQQGTQRGKFANTRASLTGGWGDLARDRFNVFGNVEVYKREALHSWRDVLPDVNPVYPAKFSTFGSPSSYAWPGNVIGVGPVQGCAVVTGNLCRYDRYSAFEVQPGAQRANLLIHARYLPADGLEGYSELLYSRAKNDYGSTHSIYGIGNDSTWGDPRTGKGLTFIHRGLPAGHPLNPTGEEVEFRYRFLDDGAGQNLKTDQYRFLTGLQGRLGAYDWDVAAGVMGGKTKMAIRGRLSDSGFKELIGDYNADVLAPDFFNKPNGYKIGQTNSAAVLARLFPSYGWDGDVKQFFIDGKLSGELMRWSTGPVEFATGFDLRRETMKITPTDNLQTGDIVGLGTSRSDGSRTNGAVFAEVSWPLAKTLNLTTAGRLDKYKGFDAHFSPMAKFKFQPHPQIALRGTAEGGFRAPNLTESAQSLKFSFNNGTNDPMRCDPALALAADLRKAASQLPAGQDPSLLLARADRIEQAECAGGVANLTRNNPALKPETSRSWTLGLVLEPAKGWNLTLDYYNIYRKNEIGLKPIEDLLSSEASQPPGVIVRETDPARDTSFTPAERAQYGVTVGQLLSTSGQFENLLKTRTSGVDVALQSQTRWPIGTFSWTVDLNYLIKYQEWRTERDSWGDNLAGRYGYSRVTLGNTFALKSGDFTHALRYVMKSPQALRRDVNENTWTLADCQRKNLSVAECQVDRYQRFDYGISYSGFKNLVLSFHVRNLLNDRPPVDFRDFSVSGGNIIPQNREDVMGRLYRLTLEYSFK